MHRASPTVVELFVWHRSSIASFEALTTLLYNPANMNFQDDPAPIMWRLHLCSAPDTDLTLSDAGVPAADRAEVTAGWVSVLLALKAAVDFGVDLRNHDRQRTWGTGYADN